MDKFVIKSFKVTKEKATTSLNFNYTGEAGFLKFSKPKIGQYKTWGATKWPWSETNPDPTELSIIVGGFQAVSEIVKVDGPTNIGIAWMIRDPWGAWPQHLDWIQVEDISVEYFPADSDMGPVESEKYTRTTTTNPEGLK